MDKDLELSRGEGTKKGNFYNRRDFLRHFLAGSALTLASLAEANNAIYQSISSLNARFLESESPDGAYWEAIRKHFVFDDRLIMMNNGTVGPMPRPVFNTLTRWFRVQMTNPFDVYNFLPEKAEEVRKKLASFVNASPEEVIITHNTTEGINFVANGLDLKPGDEVLMSQLEHPGALHPWRLKAKRSGVVIKEVKIPITPRKVDEIVDAFAAAITPRTRIISVGHTVFITGLITPIKELSAMAHEKGILVLADSAHGLGMLDLDLKALGVDFFASSPYKWLGAPCGVGLLYIRQEVQDELWPTIVTSGWDTYPDARRFGTHGQDADALILALGEALDFQRAIGPRRIEKRIKVLSAYLRQQLRTIPGVKINTPEDPYLSAGLTAFSLEGVDPAKIVDYLRERYNLVVRTIGNKETGTYAVRVSTPIYVSRDDIDHLVEGVKELASHRS